uniref:Uncharacterized protein n=1 Tax=Anopheles atroparvus TaxID=41427 RepID=A0AAG5D859_ANOAO
MSETDIPHLADAKRTVPQMKVNRIERDLWNAFRVWAPSSQTQQLASEANRALFAELLSFREDKKCRPFESDATKPEVTPRVPERLASVVVEMLVENFNGGPEPGGLSGSQREDFGNMLSTNLHLMKIIDLDIESFWRRVVWCCSADRLAYYEHDLDRNFDWKRFGIELKLAQMVEQQDPQYWEIEGLEDTVKRAAPYVENLSIEQLMPFPLVPPLEGYESYRLASTPEALCHHGSLSILGHLENLTSLSLVFGVKNWTNPYRSRYSRFSVADV